MGLVQSLVCAVILCFERVVSWTCCALMLMVIMGMIVVLTIYGISLGYHYAQKELATFASGNGGENALRSGQETLNEPVVRLVAVNRSQGEQPTAIPSDQYEARSITVPLFMESTATPVFILESERPTKEIELTPHERELARRLIGRFRRARRNNSTSIPSLNPWDNNTDVASSTDTITAT